ncbi:MAG TPA: hypothetical protein VJM50_02675 [Pyrinomonadaceae bacterium]|nr:hypothetical protein [Pyrinomonadaceae bacterium]
MEVFEVFDRPASQRFYAVAGRLLFIECLDLQLRKLIEQLFAGWQLTPVSFPEQSPDIRIEFFCGDSPAQIPGNLNPFETADGGQCYTDRGALYLALGTALIHLENGAPVTVRVWFSEVPVAGDVLPARATGFAICAALRRVGIFELHSAGMVHPDSDKGVLIVGRSGSGKSTLASQLALAGWPYLSDDELLLSLVDAQVEARGFRSFFALRDAAGVRTCFEPDAMFESGRRVKASPGVLLFMSLSGQQKTLLNPLTQTESMTRLIRACPWATYDTSIAGANLELLSKLARQTSAFELHASQDLLEPGYAASLLSASLCLGG